MIRVGSDRQIPRQFAAGLMSTLKEYGDKELRRQFMRSVWGVLFGLYLLVCDCQVVDPLKTMRFSILKILLNQWEIR